ncbi:hypothetical protein [Geodermatophilus sabuli]|uniref:Uncharacterized protein n=1 Tax=Geodermatophilus sabuli TaxID=1564158 RepID=A0A285EEZ9_9ACTN|nr:hypothetical protein [Geodermatophilus sabuli]MBB3086660.1 hypothetical protein [Geodermatophilus sabuli]SNX97688.1 hypothetical protein SAMN06893097_10853 [Geodermatophilus sabuli]
MGRRKPGKYPYDYTLGDDARFADSGVGGTMRVLHGPGRDMGSTEGVVCQVDVRGQDGALLDDAEAGKLGKEHRLHGTAPGDRIDATVSAHHAAGPDGELTATRTVVLTGDLDDVVRFGVGPGWEQVAAGTPASCHGADDPDVPALGCRCAAARGPLHMTATAAHDRAVPL